VSVPVYLVLLHSPVVNRKGEQVATSVTNMDIHDISRSARTFGLQGYFLVTPIQDQHEVVEQILSYWRSERSQKNHPARALAVSLARLARDFDEVKTVIRGAHGMDPEVVLTDARPHPSSSSYADYRRELESPERNESGRPVALVFGTGWGVSESFYPEVHRILAPVHGPGGPQSEGGYNHLSVRAAAAIILDRLFGN
jgi:hypothetical protein